MQRKEEKEKEQEREKQRERERPLRGNQLSPLINRFIISLTNHTPHNDELKCTEQEEGSGRERERDKGQITGKTGSV